MIRSCKKRRENQNIIRRLDQAMLVLGQRDYRPMGDNPSDRGLPTPPPPEE